MPVKPTNSRRAKSKTTASRSTSRKAGSRPARKAAARRETIDTGRDKRYVRRDSEGQFKESDDQGGSLGQDKARKSATAAKRGQGDKGDRKPGAASTKGPKRAASSRGTGRSAMNMSR